MKISLTLIFIITYVIILLAIAFFTLLERKGLGYFQIRKGPNKVGIAGLPQPLADALKLFTKEVSIPTLSNTVPFIIAPSAGLFLALILWILYPHAYPLFFIAFGTIFFLCVSRINVYTTLGAGWSSNSKYSLLGALRGIAQTISYEVRITLILLSALIALSSLNFNDIFNSQLTPISLLCLPLLFTWFTTTLAETNRTPFDFAEGESELVSGFNTEYRRGLFALIFIAEYINIIIISLLTALFFFSFPVSPIVSPLIISGATTALAFTFIWVRASYPRIRYDRLIQLTWKGFLPFSLGLLMLATPLICIT